MRGAHGYSFTEMEACYTAAPRLPASPYALAVCPPEPGEHLGTCSLQERSVHSAPPLGPSPAVAHLFASPPSNPPHAQLPAPRVPLHGAGCLSRHDSWGRAHV